MSAPNGAAPVLIELVDASLTLGGTQALRGVSLTVRAGDRIALIGANGAGKSSLLRLLHGLVAADGPARARPRQDRPVRAAMVFQKPFVLNASVAANVALGPLLRGMDRARRQQRVVEALQRVGLQGLADRNATTLSGGQQQRLAFARAWALAPQVLFLDEPTASLDPSAKAEVEALVASLSAEGLTWVMSSHNLGQVKRLASQVVCLDEGRVAAQGSTADFFERQDLPDRAQAFLRGELPWAWPLR